MRHAANFALRSVRNGLSRPFQATAFTRPLSTNSPPFGNGPDEFERRMFDDSWAGNSSSDPFYNKLDKVEKAHGRIGSRMNDENNGNNNNNNNNNNNSGFHIFDGLDESFNTLSDGMDAKLKKAAMYFEIDPEEISKDDYSFRPDMQFHTGSTYDTKDLDLKRPGVLKRPSRRQFEVTTEEVLKKADFRNVRFLVNFITEAGLIIKRNKTGISAKAQRKIAREIKTARAFGLMPFTTMGSKAFVFGRNMETLEEDYNYEVNDSRMDDDDPETL